jgi:hypothetical protein
MGRTPLERRAATGLLSASVRSGWPTLYDISWWSKAEGGLVFDVIPARAHAYLRVATPGPCAIAQTVQLRSGVGRILLWTTRKTGP